MVFFDLQMVKLVVLSQVEIPDSLWNIIWIIIFKWEDQFELKKIPLGWDAGDY